MPSKGRQRTKSQNLLDSIPRLPKKEPPTQKSKSVDELLSLTKEQLKIECRKRGQKCSGNKQELLQRLGYKMATKRKELNSLPNTNGSVVQNNVNHKVVDKETSLEGQRKQREREIFERKNIVLWKKPMLTLEYFLRECFELTTEYSKRLLAHRVLVFLLGTLITMWYILLNIKSPFQQLLQRGYRRILWCLKWLGLGTASSVGFGVGFHTFLLYLGPHIARVTIAAYSCGTLNFTEPPYPDEIICPEGDSGNGKVSILRIMSKVRLEAILWGAGTALGELPPYFMARAARQSGVTDEEDEDLKEFEELQRKQREGEPLTFVERGKLFVENLVQKVGFFGILLCASVPNPLFDLAGITCGHFLVPFWTFFGATLIGKAIVKMHIQKLFVIIAFSETLIETALSYLALVPMIGEKLQAPFKEFLDGQKDKFHHASSHADESSVLNTAFSILYLGLFMCFVLPIVNAFAQSYHKRIHKKKSLRAKQ